MDVHAMICRPQNRLLLFLFFRQPNIFARSFFLLHLRAVECRCEVERRNTMISVCTQAHSDRYTAVMNLWYFAVCAFTALITRKMIYICSGRGKHSQSTRNYVWNFRQQKWHTHTLRSTGVNCAERAASTNWKRCQISLLGASCRRYFEVLHELCKVDDGMCAVGTDAASIFIHHWSLALPFAVRVIRDGHPSVIHFITDSCNHCRLTQK